MLHANYNPDVLNFLANLSSDEVFTPPHVAKQMLDLLPEEIWSDKEATFLDPAVKSGVFLREIAKRLTDGLEKEIPDLQARVNHIMTRQVFGIGITELTSLLARRSLYCSKHADGKFSICDGFENENGNIFFDRIEHEWKNEKCVHCSASKNNYDREEPLETHAYQFIHRQIPERIKNMKFDVIIGNPPYQLSDGGHGASATPIYHKFVQNAQRLNPRYVSMIIPARWYAGGKGLDSFRETMLDDNRITKLFDYPIASDVFPGVKVIGGICYFLWERDTRAKCQVTCNFGKNSSTLKRRMNQFDTFVRFNEAVTILEKILEKKLPSQSEFVSKGKPFGLRTFEKPSGTGDIMLYANGQQGRIERAKITSGHNLIAKWKVFISQGYGEGGEGREYPRQIIGKPIVAPPQSACTETYIVAGAFDSKNEATNFAKFLTTKFARFLIALKKNTQHTTRERFLFVPRLKMTNEWTDKKLFNEFDISTEEKKFIDSLVKPLEIG